MQRYKTSNNWSKKELFSVRTKPSYNKILFENLLAIEMRKTQLLMNKPAYLGVSILELSKIVIYEFCNDYVKPKYHGKTNLRYKYTESFIDLVNTDDIYKYIAKDVETRSDTSDFARKKPLLKGSIIKK